MISLLKTERAWQRYLLGSAAYLITGEGEYVVTDKGLKITLASGYQFFLPVLRGQDDFEVSAPAVIASCPKGVQVERNSLEMLVDCEIVLRFPVDEGKKPETRDRLEGFEYAAAQLAVALYQQTLPERLTAGAEGFRCTFQRGTWTEESGFTGRLRTYRWTRQITVIPTTFPG